MSDTVSRAKVSLALAAGVAAVTLLGVFLWARHPATGQASAQPFSAYPRPGPAPAAPRLAVDPGAAAAASAPVVPDVAATPAAPPDTPGAGTPAAAVDWTDAMRTELARLESPAVPVEERLKSLAELGRRGDAPAVAVLQALGDQNTYLNYAAVAALGQVQTAAVGDYLRGKLAHPDHRVLSAAVTALAAAEGERALPVIVATLAANRRRPDGHQGSVCGACVKALAAIGSPAGVPALADEFVKTVGKTLHHEYGSQVVAAIKAIGDVSGAPALNAYMVRLEKERAAMTDNPMGQRYLEGKIEETRAALTAVRK